MSVRETVRPSLESAHEKEYEESVAYFDQLAPQRPVPIDQIYAELSKIIDGEGCLPILAEVIPELVGCLIDFFLRQLSLKELPQKETLPDIRTVAYTFATHLKNIMTADGVLKCIPDEIKLNPSSSSSRRYWVLNAEDEELSIECTVNDKKGQQLHVLIKDKANEERSLQVIFIFLQDLPNKVEFEIRWWGNVSDHHLKTLAGAEALPILTEAIAHCVCNAMGPAVLENWHRELLLSLRTQL